MYGCEHVDTKYPFAVKAESTTTKYSLHKNELEVYQALGCDAPGSKCPNGFPRVYGHGTTECKGQMCKYLTMDRLGETMEDLRLRCGGHLDEKSVTMFLIQMLHRLETLHNAGYIYRDLRPDNIMIGRNDKTNLIHLVDMGAATHYIKDGKHIEREAVGGYDGTLEFLSTDVLMNACTMSRRSDIEALGWLCVYLWMGHLPWSRVRFTNEREYAAELRRRRAYTFPTDFLKSSVDCPPVYVHLIMYAQDLGFDETPDYAGLRDQIIRFTEEDRGISLDDVFEWMSDLDTERSFASASSSSSSAKSSFRSGGLQSGPIGFL